MKKQLNEEKKKKKNLGVDYYGLLERILPLEDMVEIVEKEEGNHFKKQMLLDEIQARLERKENTPLKEALESVEVKEQPIKLPIVSLNGYKDDNERVHIFKKRLRMFLNEE